MLMRKFLTDCYEVAFLGEMVIKSWFAVTGGKWPPSGFVVSVFSWITKQTVMHPGPETSPWISHYILIWNKKLHHVGGEVEICWNSLPLWPFLARGICQAFSCNHSQWKNGPVICLRINLTPQALFDGAFTYQKKKQKTKTEAPTKVTQSSPHWESAHLSTMKPSLLLLWRRAIRPRKCPPFLPAETDCLNHWDRNSPHLRFIENSGCEPLLNATGQAHTLFN